MVSSEQPVLPVEQLGIEILEQLQHQVLLGAEMIVNLAERHAGFCRDFAGREAGIAGMRSTFLAASSRLVLVSIFFTAARAILSRDVIDLAKRYMNSAAMARRAVTPADC